MMNEEAPFEILASEPETINPAILLAEDLMRRQAFDLLTVEEVRNAEVVLEIGANEIKQIEQHKAAFLKSPASSGMSIPSGF